MLVSAEVPDNVQNLAAKLARLEGKLGRLERTREAIVSARSLVAEALHHASEAKGDDADLEDIYRRGFTVLSQLAERACRQVVDVEIAFMQAVKDDAVVGAALEAAHQAMPLSELWTGESYPKP